MYDVMYSDYDSLYDSDGSEDSFNDPLQFYERLIDKMSNSAPHKKVIIGL